VIGTFFSGMPALVYLVAGLVVSYDVTHGISAGITAGTIVAFTTLQSRLFFPIGSMLQVSVEVQGSLALFERIFEYLQMPHDIVDPPDARRLDPATARGDVRLDNLYFRYDRSAFGEIAPDEGPDALVAAGHNGEAPGADGE